jgi:hypothetical protein
MDLYKGLIVTQIRSYYIDDKHCFNMIGADFKIIALELNYILLEGHGITIKINDDSFEEYFMINKYEKIRNDFKELRASIREITDAQLKLDKLWCEVNEYIK